LPDATGFDLNHQPLQKCLQTSPLLRLGDLLAAHPVAHSQPQWHQGTCPASCTKAPDATIPPKYSLPVPHLMNIAFLPQRPMQHSNFKSIQLSQTA
jgi:hypothetical protein